MKRHGTRTTHLQVIAINNTPAPYRHALYEAIAATDDQFSLLYLKHQEAGRNWAQPDGAPWFSVVMPSRNASINLYHILKALHRCRKARLIVAGFGPLQLLLLSPSLLFRRPFALHTDGTLRSERHLGPIHRIIRRFLFPRASAVIVASEAGERMVRFYGVAAHRVFKSAVPYIPSEHFESLNSTIQFRDVDILFCGRLEAIKNPHFVLDVAQRVSEILDRSVSVVFVGNGSLLQSVRGAANGFRSLQVHFPGYLGPREIEAFYRRSKCLVVPSVREPWGLVVTEALAQGVFVITSPAVTAGVELLNSEGLLGRVLPLGVDAWAEAVATQLSLTPSASEVDSRTSRISVRRILHSQSLESAEEGYVKALAALRRKSYHDQTKKSG